jgi:TolB-like protein/Flp pilus assembly protein TadD
MLGTMPYMAPEQLKGRPTDRRSDIFSLGVILYELSTGRRPFTGPTAPVLVTSILRDKPVPVTERNPDVPHHLWRIIRHCLAKRPKDRFQSARDVYNELKGLKREVDSGEVRPVSSTASVVVTARKRRWPAVAATALIVALAGFAWLEVSERAAREADSGVADVVRPTMIVVLPFDNQGPSDNAYFAAGITEEITSRLSAVHGLAVISRGTASRYDRGGKTTRQIADDLSVDYVLDGSVRWSAEDEDVPRVRITPQLTRTSDDTQVWSQPYDRKIEDIFAVQSDIAANVAQQLGISLLGQERRALQVRPTESLEAYQAYLRGMGYFLQPGPENQKLAVEMFERAVELDPDFALAHAKIAQRSAFLHFQPDLSADWLAKAEAALERARALAPDLAEVRLAEGYLHYHGYGRYEPALEAFEAAARDRPNDSQILAAIGFIHRRQGRMEQALGELERALELDPHNAELLVDVASTHQAFRRFERTDRLLDRGIELFPHHALFYALKAANLLSWEGAIDEARTVLAGAPASDQLLPTLVMLDWYDRDYDRALERLLPFAQAAPIATEQIGWTYLLLGREALAREHLEIALVTWEELARSAPENPVFLSGMAYVRAALGQRDEAIRDAERAIELRRGDAYSGPMYTETLASVYSLSGEAEKALDLIEHLLSIPYETPLTLAELRLGPEWDPLRAEPRFQELLAGAAK